MQLLSLTFLNACFDHRPAFGGDLQVGGDAESEVVRGPETRQSPCLLEALLDGSLSLQARRQQTCACVNNGRCIQKLRELCKSAYQCSCALRTMLLHKC